MVLIIQIAVGVLLGVILLAFLPTILELLGGLIRGIGWVLLWVAIIAGLYGIYYGIYLLVGEIETPWNCDRKVGCIKVIDLFHAFIAILFVGAIAFGLLYSWWKNLNEFEWFKKFRNRRGGNDKSRKSKNDFEKIPPKF